MSEAETMDRWGNPWSAYVRRIDFTCAKFTDNGTAPVHVLRQTLFDGVIAPCRLARENVTVDLTALDATVVTLHAHRDDIQIGNDTQPYMLGDRLVLTPVGHGWDWVPVDPENPEDPWVAVSIFVAEVHVA